jgi:hypothetical protein
MMKNIESKSDLFETINLERENIVTSYEKDKGVLLEDDYRYVQSKNMIKIPEEEFDNIELIANHRGKTEYIDVHPLCMVYYYNLINSKSHVMQKLDNPNWWDNHTRVVIIENKKYIQLSVDGVSVLVGLQ